MNGNCKKINLLTYSVVFSTVSYTLFIFLSSFKYISNIYLTISNGTIMASMHTEHVFCD